MSDNPFEKPMTIKQIIFCWVIVILLIIVQIYFNQSPNFIKQEQSCETIKPI
jgi:hypothetical protein